jgi:hypothetical protein
MIKRYAQREREGGSLWSRRTSITRVLGVEALVGVDLLLEDVERQLVHRLAGLFSGHVEEQPGPVTDKPEDVQDSEKDKRRLREEGREGLSANRSLPRSERARRAT